MGARNRWLVLACVLPLPAGFAQPVPDAAAAPIFADQGWSAEQRSSWYTISQGSRLIPWEWLKALEQPDTSDAFLDPQHVEKFRYLPPDPSSPVPLPLGFALDWQSDADFGVTRLRWKRGQGEREPWVGMNCSACHTGELTYQGQRLRVDGAPTLADFQGLMRSFTLALTNTHKDPAKWQRFAGKVLGADADQTDEALLDSAFTKLMDWQTQTEQANDTPLQYGYGRLDAFGNIYNKVLLRVQANSQPRNPSDAPVSYPFLWNIAQHDKVQWNGSAPNFPVDPTLDLGALARNVGEVTGVFADVTVRRFGPAAQGYPTSADLRHLLSIEQQLATLKPPAWPKEFPAIDPVKWQAGKVLFGARCAGCHAPLARDDLKTRITAKMTSLSGPGAIGTDPWMACNAYTYSGNTGLLLGSFKKFFPSLPYGPTAPVSDMLGTVVVGSIWYRGPSLIDNLQVRLQQLKPFDLKQVSANTLMLEAAIRADVFADRNDLPPDRAARLKLCTSQSSPSLAYKGRPLTGVWPTAPFLHNGSVPTLYDLLLPPAQRPPRFSVGTREFDPEKVGLAYENSSARYLTERAKSENTFVFMTSDGGKPIAGNSNLGHDYGNAGFSDADRWALVEYLKAAGGRLVGDQIDP